MRKFVVLLLALAFLSGCIKTAEQARREKRLESMSEQLNDSQGLMVDMVEKVKNLETQNDRLTGRIEELEHKQGKTSSEQSKKIDETINLLKSQQDAQSSQLAQIQAELKEQRAFLEKVTDGLKDLHHKPTHSTSIESKGKKKSTKEELSAALELVKNNKFEDARTELESLIDHQELTPGEHNKVIHGLGRVEYHTKNYEKSLVYFSKIFSKYPKSSLAPSSLLFIGRSLKKLGKKEEAKEALLKVTEDYPGTKEAMLAKKEQ